MVFSNLPDDAKNFGIYSHGGTAWGSSVGGVLSIFRPLVKNLHEARFAREMRRLKRNFLPKEICIFLQHVGLGDHIICNAAVRRIGRSFRVVVLPVLKKNAPTVRAMFGDLPNVKVLTMTKLYDPFLVARAFERQGATIIRTGQYDPMWRYEMGMYFDSAFYDQLGIPFDERWTGFNVPRDLNAEEKVFKAVAPKGRYVFVHDDASRGFSIDDARMPKDAIRVRPQLGLTDVLFHYRKVIEGAAEVHCISSSFAQYLECAPSGSPQYLHRYPRMDNTWSTWRNFDVVD